MPMNAMEWNRDQRWTVKQIRESEKGFTSKDIENVMYLNFVGYLKGYFDK